MLSTKRHTSTKTASSSPAWSRNTNGGDKRNAKSLHCLANNRRSNSSRNYKKLIDDGEKRKKWSPDRSNRWHTSGTKKDPMPHQALHKTNGPNRKSKGNFSFLPHVYMERVEVESFEEISRLSTNVSSWSTDDSGSGNDQNSSGKAKKVVSFLEQDDYILTMPSSTSSKPRRLTRAEKETLYAERPDLKNSVNYTPWNDDALWDVQFLNERLEEMRIASEDMERKEIEEEKTQVQKCAKKQVVPRKQVWNWLLDYSPCAANYYTCMAD